MSHYPQRIGEPDCRDFLRTGRCKYGDSCKYHHPFGGMKTCDPSQPPFPIRPDEPLCQYFLKNGTCKFGQSCKFHHPPHMVGKPRMHNPFNAGQGQGGTAMNPGDSHHKPPTDDIDLGLSLPQRPSEPDCIYFLKHGRCKYGVTCKYHHPVSAHMMPVNSSKYASPNPGICYPVDRERTVSIGSLTEVQETHNQGTSTRRAATQVYQQQIENRKVVDSVPQRSRNDILGTISNSYHPYSHQQLDQMNAQQRYLKSNTPDGSPTLGSPSITSSTLASSYDTAVSTFEKLPQALFQNQHMNIGRTLSNNSSSEGPLPFDDGAAPYSYEQSRISNIRHYSKAPMPTRSINNHLMSEMDGSSAHANNGVSAGDNTRLPMNANLFDDRSNFRHERQQNGSLNRRGSGSMHRRESLDKPIQQPQAVDDGLSMMTSALLTMLDAPGNGTHENADTISTHSSNFEDANALIASAHDPLFVSRSLPEFVSSQLSGPGVQHHKSDFNALPNVFPSSHAQNQYATSHGQQQYGSLSQTQPQPLMVPNPPNYQHTLIPRRRSFNEHLYNNMNNTGQNSRHLGDFRAVAKPVADTQRTLQTKNFNSNPNSDTVGSTCSPIQFPMAP